MSAPVIEWQILATDPKAVADFYGQLFDWVVDAENPLGYRRISSAGATGIAGGIWPAPQTARNFVQLFIAVDDVAKHYGQAQSLGAKSIVAPQVLPDGDELAIMLDPFGMAFGIIRKGAANGLTAAK
jgi:predicted enzyme related to lactoylglutathione lyase